jgi:hypothetical protein
MVGNRSLLQAAKAGISYYLVILTADRNCAPLYAYAMLDFDLEVH